MTQRTEIGRNNSWKNTSWKVLKTGIRHLNLEPRVEIKNYILRERAREWPNHKPTIVQVGKFIEIQWVANHIWSGKDQCATKPEALHTIHNKFQKQFQLHIGDSFWIRTQQNGQPLSPMRTGSQFSRLADWRSQPSRDKRICIVDNKAFWLVPWSPRSS